MVNIVSTRFPKVSTYSLSNDHSSRLYRRVLYAPSFLAVPRAIVLDVVCARI